MKKFVKRSINKILGSYGLRLIKIDQAPSIAEEYKCLAEKHRNLVDEMNACFMELLFPGLPDSERRIDLMTKLIGTPVSEALYILAYLHLSLGVAGDVCEFGIAQGATSALLANEIRGTDKKLWLFDSFKGLGRPSEQDLLIDDIFNLGSIEKYEGTMACGIEQVKSRLEDISFPLAKTRVVAGFIEETIKRGDLPEEVCFAYIDFDFYNPIRMTLQFLREHLSPGGVALVDDYGFFSAGARSAVDEFLEAYRDEFEMSLPHKFAGRTTPFCIIRKKHKHI